MVAQKTSSSVSSPPMQPGFLTGLPVDAGPAEATAIGNILMQAIATKQLKSFKEMRKIVRNSFEIKTYLPKNVSEWDEMYETHT